MLISFGYLPGTICTDSLRDEGLSDHLQGATRGCTGHCFAVLATVC